MNSKGLYFLSNFFMLYLNCNHIYGVCLFLGLQMSSVCWYSCGALREKSTVSSPCLVLMDTSCCNYGSVLTPSSSSEPSSDITSKFTHRRSLPLSFQPYIKAELCNIKNYLLPEMKCDIREYVPIREYKERFNFEWTVYVQRSRRSSSLDFVLQIWTTKIMGQNIRSFEVLHNVV